MMLIESAGELLDRGLKALTRADAEELLRVAELAPKSDWPATIPEREATAEKYRAFRKFLILTDRNLRLLRNSPPMSGGWCDRRD